MKKLLILCSIVLLMSSAAMASSKYIKIEPEFCKLRKVQAMKKLMKLLQLFSAR